eukprot:5461529-Amphidinium_carterae.1
MYARTLWRAHWVRVYKISKLKKVTDIAPAFDIPMTDDSDTIGAICATLDYLMDRLHCPIQLHSGRVQFYGCDSGQRRDPVIVVFPTERRAYSANKNYYILNTFQDF